MRILVISDEVWNDTIHGNNVLSNWFQGFSAEFANIYCSPGFPKNTCCDRYFQITDGMMIQSILKGKQAGIVTRMQGKCDKKYNSTDVENIGWMRKYCGDLLRFLKSVVWTFGRYNEDALGKFISDFQPDIIFSPRYANPKILRLERVVKKYANCPMIAFTGDNEYSLRMVCYSPFGWINKFWTRAALKKNSDMYSLYYTLSDEQKAEYEKVFHCPIKILRKCTPPSVKTLPEITPLHKPIKMVYAGKLYYERWKTLAQIGSTIHTLNVGNKKFQLDIYTADILDNQEKKALNFPESVYIHGPVSQEEVLKIYRDSDIALHVESFQRKYRLLTRVSFSTKIIDCLSCGCALMTVAWKEHSGLTYLKREDASLCVDDLKKLPDILKMIGENSSQLQSYKEKAVSCLKRNHMRAAVQNELFLDFQKAIESK